MVSGDKENISVLLASFENPSDSLVCGRDTLNGSLVHSRVTNHVWRREVIHEESIFLLRDPLCQLVSDRAGTHLRIEVICGDLGRGYHLSDFARELLLDTAVEEEGDVRIFFCFRNMALLHVLLAEPFCHNIAHVLGWESDWEWVVSLVLGHRCDMDVLGVGEIGFRRAIDISKKLGYFADSIGAVIEEEQGIVIWRVIRVGGRENAQSAEYGDKRGSYLELCSPCLRQ